MKQPIVLITFYSRCGTTERLACAAAVGAVQERALIRLRRMPDVCEFVDCSEIIRRMQKEYVAPQEADILNADALVVAVPAGFTKASPECAPYFMLLDRLRAEGKLAGKVERTIDPASSVANATAFGRDTASRIREQRELL